MGGGKGYVAPPFKNYWGGGGGGGWPPLHPPPLLTPMICTQQALESNLHRNNADVMRCHRISIASVPIKRCGRSKNNYTYKCKEMEKHLSSNKRGESWALERGYRLLVTFLLFVISNRRMKINNFFLLIKTCLCQE